MGRVVVVRHDEILGTDAVRPLRILDRKNLVEFAHLIRLSPRANQLLAPAS